MWLIYQLKRNRADMKPPGPRLGVNGEQRRQAATVFGLAGCSNRKREAFERLEKGT